MTQAGGRGRTGGTGRIIVLIACFGAGPAPAAAQTLTQRGFFEGKTSLFPQQAPNDPTLAVGDLLLREELFFKPASWLRFAGGLELRANSHAQVDDR